MPHAARRMPHAACRAVARQRAALVVRHHLLWLYLLWLYLLWLYLLWLHLAWRHVLWRTRSTGRRR